MLRLPNSQPNPSSAERVPHFADVPFLVFHLRATPEGAEVVYDDGIRVTHMLSFTTPYPKKTTLEYIINIAMKRLQAKFREQLSGFQYEIVPEEFFMTKLLLYRSGYRPFDLLDQRVLGIDKKTALKQRTGVTESGTKWVTTAGPNKSVWIKFY